MAVKSIAGMRGPGGGWKGAVALLNSAESKYGVLPNVVTHNTVITAVGREGQWKKALKLLAEMSTRSLVPDAISYNACISVSAAVVVAWGRSGAARRVGGRRQFQFS